MLQDLQVAHDHLIFSHPTWENMWHSHYVTSPQGGQDILCSSFVDATDTVLAHYVSAESKSKRTASNSQKKELISWSWQKGSWSWWSKESSLKTWDHPHCRCGCTRKPTYCGTTSSLAESPWAFSISRDCIFDSSTLTSGHTWEPARRMSHVNSM